MENLLTEFLSKITNLSVEERITIQNSFPTKTFDKGYMLLKEGMIALDSYFVISGCVREYELTDGVETTTAFYTENDSVIDFHSQINRVPSSKYFECVEETKVSISNIDKEKELYIKYPLFEKYCKEGMEKMMAEQQKKMSKFISSDSTERYLALVKERPDLINRVPQYQIASYLGVKPETLSRIRKKLSSKS